MTDKIIDIAVLTDLRSTTGRAFVADLLDTFLEETPGILATLRAARAAADGDKFRRAAHSLKSNASTFGATRLAALARALELKGLDADPERDAALLSELEADHAAAAAALKAMRDD